MDLAGQEYWEEAWENRKILGSINLKNYTQSRFDYLFNHYLPQKKDIKLLEAGCAQSSWLPYFRLRFGYEISGIDYSETGCEKAQQNLLRYGVEGSVLCRDFMDESHDLMENFDVVFSYGVIEHYESPEIVLKRFFNFLKPDGIIVTVIPNISGMMGKLQRFVNPPVYEIHVPMSVDDLRKAHLSSGFKEISSGYIGSLGTEVVNYPVDAGIGLNVLRKLLKWISKASWLIFRLTGWHPESHALSPYIFFIGNK